MILILKGQSIVEIELDDDSTIWELANAFRALALVQGYPINLINEFIPPIDHECR